MDDDAPEFVDVRFPVDHLRSLRWAIRDKQDEAHQDGDDDREVMWNQMNESITKALAKAGDKSAERTAMWVFAKRCLLDTPDDRAGDLDAVETNLREYLDEYRDDSDALHFALIDAGTAREDAEAIADDVDKGRHLRLPDEYRDD